MLNARRSALYIAIIGLGFAAADASAACPAGTRAVSTYTAGYKTTVCVKTGSEIVDVTVEPLAIDGPEGPLTNATVQVSMTGSSPTGDPPGMIDIDLFQTQTNNNGNRYGWYKPKPPKPPKPPKSKQCVVSIPDNNDCDDDGNYLRKRKAQCIVVGDANSPPLLSDGDGRVDTLTSPEKDMRCNLGKAKCETNVEILPTGLTCDDTGTEAIDFTAQTEPRQQHVHPDRERDGVRPA